MFRIFRDYLCKKSFECIFWTTFWQLFQHLYSDRFLKLFLPNSGFRGQTLCVVAQIPFHRKSRRCCAIVARVITGPAKTYGWNYFVTRRGRQSNRIKRMCIELIGLFFFFFSYRRNNNETDGHRKNATDRGQRKYAFKRVSRSRRITSFRDVSEKSSGNALKKQHAFDVAFGFDRALHAGDSVSGTRVHASRANFLCATRADGFISQFYRCRRRLITFCRVPSRRVTSPL